MSRQIRLCIAALSLLLLSSNCAYAQVTITDDFNDGVINPVLWTVDDPGAVSVAEAGGVAVVSAGVIGGYAQVELECNQGAIGDFDVSYDYQWINGVGSSRTRTQLHVIEINGSGSFVLNFWRGGGSPDGDLIYSRDDATIGHTWNPPSVGALRIRRVGQVFYGYYRLSGGWISLGSATGFTGPAAVVLHGNTNGGSVFEVRWDNFVLVAGSSVVGAETNTWGSVKALYR